MKSAAIFAAALALGLAIAPRAASAEPLAGPGGSGLRPLATPAHATPQIDRTVLETAPALAKDAIATENEPARDASLAGGLQPNPKALLLLGAILQSGRFNCCR